MTMLSRQVAKFILLGLLLLHINHANGQAFTDQREGFQILLLELETLEALIVQIERSPNMPGRYRVNYDALKEDIRIVKKGVLLVTQNPVSLDGRPRFKGNSLTGDYLE